MKKGKRILSVLLVVVMLLTAVPIAGFTKTEAEAANTDSIAVGDEITLGKYDGKPIVWVCVDIDENGPLMLSKEILCEKEFDAPGDNPAYHSDGWGYIRKERGSNCWEDSNIRQWLNSTGVVDYSHCPPSYKDEVGFLSNFTSKELLLVKKIAHKVTMVKYDSTRQGYCDGGSTDSFSWGNSFNINNCYHKLLEDCFMLLDASQYNNMVINNSPYFNCGGSYFTAVISGNNYACFELVNTVGGGSNWASASNGIRPAFYLNVDEYEAANNYSIKLYSALPSMVMGKNMSMELGVQLLKGGNPVLNDFEFSVVSSNSNILEVSDFNIDEDGLMFNVKSKEEGSVKLTVTEHTTGSVYSTNIKVSSGIMTFNAEALPKYYDRKNEYNGYYNGMYIADYKVKSGSKEDEISFDVYNTSSTIGTVEVYDENETIKSVKTIDRFNNNTVSSIKDTLYNGYKLIEDIVDGDMLTFKQDSYSKKTHIACTVPKGGCIKITNNPQKSKYCATVNATGYLVETALALSGALKDMNEVKTIEDETMQSVITKVLTETPALSDKLQKKIYEAAAKKLSISTANTIICDYLAGCKLVFEFSGIDIAELIKKTATDLGIGFAEDVFMKAIGPFGEALDIMFDFSKALDNCAWLVEMINDNGKYGFSIYVNGENGKLCNNGTYITANDTTNSLSESNFVMHSVLLLNEAVLPPAAQTTIKQIADNSVIRDIYLERDGVISQPNQPVTVSIPVPSNYDVTRCGIYWIKDDGTVEKMNASYSNGYMHFVTDHFSIYALVELKAEENNQPDTPSENCTHLCHKSGFWGWIWVIINVFNIMLGKNPVCSCGVAHY